MINLKQLSQLDIKSLNSSLSNIDMKALQDALIKRIDVLISIVLILGSLYAVYYFTTSKTEKIQLYEREVAELEEKDSAIKTLELQEKILTEFLSKTTEGLPSVTSIINYVSELVQQTDTKISSFTPGTAKEEEFFSLQEVNFSFSSPRYRDMVELTEAIENSPRNLRIEEWKKIKETYSGGFQSGNLQNEQNLFFNLKISSITIKQ